MKPLKVTMQAFGPYLKETEIDFALLGERPIFLITGATGGGKTTILDAMCFALYCRATGGKRSWSSMRTISAPDDLPTVVDYSFDLSGELYRFYRSLSVHYVRGSGRRTYREEHSCYQMTDNGWKLLQSGSETKIREFAEALLHLTCEQFSQVIVLPQGNFLKLLRSTSLEKGEILQTLFSTEIWVSLAEAAKKKADDLAQKAGELAAARAAVLQREDAQDLSGLEQNCRKARELEETALRSFEEVKRDLDAAVKTLANARALEGRFQELEKKEEELAYLSGKAELYREKREKLAFYKKIQQAAPYAAALENARSNYKMQDIARQSAAGKADHAARALSEAAENEKKLPALKESAAQLANSIVKLEASLEFAKRLEQVRLQTSRAEQGISVLKAEENEQLALRDQAETNAKKGEEYIRALQESIQRLPQITAEEQSCRKQYESLTLFAQKSELFEKAREKREQALREEKRAAIKLDALKKQLAQEECRMRQNAAGTLAAELTEGSPCPVCGAVHHPAPATLPEHYEKGRLEALREALSQEETSYRGVSQISASCVTEALHCKAELEQAGLGCSGMSLEDKPTLEQKLARLTRERQKIESDSSLLPQANARLEQRRREAKESGARLDGCRAKLAESERMLSGLLSSGRELSKSLSGNGDAEEISRELSCSQKKKAGLEQEAQRLEEALTRAKTNQAAAQAAKEAAEEAFLQAEQRLEEAAGQWDACRKALGLPPETDFSSSASFSGQIPVLEKDLQDYDSRLYSAREQAEALKKELAGKARPKLEPLQSRQTELQEKSGQLSQEIGSLRQRLKALNASLQELAALLEQGGRTERDYSQASRISRLLSGKNPLKIPIQQYVLGIMLDDILFSCNQFFSALSRGRYSLNRIQGNSGGNAFGGLDLQVLDAERGGARSIETLSGGEQFLASLSLAFGLSEVVQQYSGSVRLDSLFIDEGFGSLDQDTLDTAMKAIVMIQKMGRSVGIISHVSELKRHIAARIEVMRSQDGGSTVAVKPE